MKRELRDKWVRALRSGDYEQGSGKLRDENNRYCCLGVLKKIVSKHNRWDGNEGYPGGEDDEGKAKEYHGLSLSHQEDLADANDSGSTFCEIAEMIEANVPVEDD